MNARNARLHKKVYKGIVSEQYGKSRMKIGTAYKKNNIFAVCVFVFKRQTCSEHKVGYQRIGNARDADVRVEAVFPELFVIIQI